jgi:hypothetical protein
MRKVFLLLTVLPSLGCTTYTSIAKAGANVYLTSTTFGVSSVKRCSESAGTLICENLDVESGSAPMVQGAREVSPPRPQESPPAAQTAPARAEPVNPLSRMGERMKVLVACRNLYARNMARITTRLVVAPSGQIRSVAVDGVEPGSQFEGCVQRTIGTIQVPEFDGPEQTFSGTVDIPAK